MASTPRDDNHVPAIFGVSSLDGRTPIPVKVNPLTGAILIDSASVASGVYTPATIVVAPVGYAHKADYYTDGTDDQVQIQAAIDSLTAGFSGGGSIFIAAGVYTFSSGVIVKSTTHNIKIFGEGASTIIRWKNGNTFSINAVNSNWLFTTNSYCIITDLQLVGNSTFACPINGINTFTAGGTNTLGGGILINSARHWIDRVYITGMAEDGITNQGGIGVKYGEVEIIGCGGVGINITNTQGTSGNFATDGDYSSVWVGSCGIGISMNESASWISGAHVWGCQGDGLYINADSVRVIGGYYETNGGWGININGRTRNVIIANDVWANGLGYTSGNQTGGINLGGASNSNIITGNQLRDNRFYSLLLAGSSTENNVMGNEVTDSFSRNQGSGAAITYTASATLTTDTNFTDANNPSWITNSSCIGMTLVITGAGSAGANLTTQVTGWSNPSNGVYNITLQTAMSTAVTNPVYSVHAVAYGIRETGTATNNNISGNKVHKLAAQLGQIVINAVSNSNSTSENNVGVDHKGWFDAGTVSSGTLSPDARNGKVYHVIISANVTSVSFFPTTPLNRNTELVLFITQGGTGSNTVTGWPSNVKFANNAAPVFSTTLGVTDVIAFKYDGTNWQEIYRSLNRVLPITEGGTGQTTATTAFDALSPMTTLGDVIYGGASGANTRLAGNITSTRNFLRQTGTGSVSAAPTWDTVTKADVGLASVENTALSTWAGTTNITTLGTIATGVWSGTAIDHTKLTGIVQSDVGGLTTASTPTFAGINLSTNNLSTVGNIAMEYSAARDITVGRQPTTGAGNNLTVQAGGAHSGDTNTAAGILVLSSGISTGNSRGVIKLFVAPQGASGSGDNTPASQAALFSVSGTNGPIFAIGGTGGGQTFSPTGLTLTSNAFALNGNAVGAIEMYRHATANTAGNSITIEAGGATSTATDKSGGALVLRAGISTGTGTAQVKLQTYTKALSTGTSDNTATDRIVITSPLSVTNNTATTISSLTLVAGSIAGQNINYCVEVTDGTDYQCETGIVSFAVVNKGGVFTAGTPAKTGNVQALSSGTLTVTFSQTSANPSLIQVNANSSLTPSTGYPRITFYEANLTQQAVTVS